MNDVRVVGVDFDWHNPDSSSKLSRAVRSRNISEVRRLLKRGHSPDEPDNRGHTALHEASRGDDLLDIAELLLNSGAYIEHKTVEGETPLLIACVYSSEKIVECFLSHGCQVNNANIDSVTPLHIACSKQNYNIIRMLIDAGASINAKDNEMLTPLFYAIQFENLPAVKILLEKGCNAETIDYFSRTPLQFSCMVGDLEIFELLVAHLGLSKELVNRQTSDGWTLLMEAIQFKKYKIAEKLISYGADTSLVDSRGLLALHLAAHSGRTDCLELMISSTPTEVIEKYATSKMIWHNKLLHTRSLPCLLIDSDMFDGLKLLFDSGVSDEVLSCPAKMGDSVVGPTSFLLLYGNKILPPDKTKYLELLLTKDALKDPNYGFRDFDNYVTRSVEAAVWSHNQSHEDCNCELVLSMLLNEEVSADLPRQKYCLDPVKDVGGAFMRAVSNCFVKGLALLLVHSALYEPENVLDYVADRMKKVDVTKGDEAVAKFLVWAATDTKPVFRTMAQFVSKAPDKVRLISVFEAVKAKAFSVPSLRRLSRRCVRSHVRGFSTVEPFRNVLKSLPIPQMLISYLLYENLLAYSPAPD